ncbi:MAG TPA: hypothetical protein VIG33_00510 [Pseudobdellovibrionaceae bacterium]
MRFLAAWFPNPGEYWMNIVILILFIAASVWGLRKIQSKRRQ